MLLKSSFKIICISHICFTVFEALKYINSKHMNGAGRLAKGGRASLKFVHKFERVEGIGPSPKDWKSLVLPLNYTRIVGDTGFEPAASRSQTVRANQLRQSPVRRTNYFIILRF